MAPKTEASSVESTPVQGRDISWKNELVTETSAVPL